MRHTPEAAGWFGDTTAPPEIGLPPRRIADIVRYELRDLPLNGFPVALQPIAVPKESYRDLLDATGRLLGLLKRAALRLAEDRPGRIAALGIDPQDCPHFTADEAYELRHCADMARADVVIGADGPKFVEFNVSGAFGGMVHFQMYQRAWQRIRAEAGRPAFLGVDPFARLALLIEQTCRELGVAPSAVLVGTPREWGPDTPTRHFDVQAAMLRRHGVDAVHLDFEELLAGIGERPLGVGEFTVQDARAIGYDTTPVDQALAAGFRLLPSQSAWLLHSKKLLAMLSEGLPWMSADERALAARYLPWSRVIGDRKADWRGRTYDLPGLLIEERERFVIKGATGCSGQEVTFGATTGGSEWAALVAEAVESGYYIAQEVVEAVRYPVDVMVDESGTVERWRANPVISPFCIGGTGAGCFARFDQADPERPGVVSALSHAALGCLLGQA